MHGCKILSNVECVYLLLYKCARLFIVIFSLSRHFQIRQQILGADRVRNGGSQGCRCQSMVVKTTNQRKAYIASWDPISFKLYHIFNWTYVLGTKHQNNFLHEVVLSEYYWFPFSSLSLVNLSCITLCKAKGSYNLNLSCIFVVSQHQNLGVLSCKLWQNHHASVRHPVSICCRIWKCLLKEKMTINGPAHLYSNTYTL